MNPLFLSAGLASLACASCDNSGSRTAANPDRVGKVETPQGAMGPPHDVDLDGRPNWRDPYPQFADEKVAVIEHLPNGYRVVEHDGKRYYRAGNVFYQSRGTGYAVVPDPH